MCEMWLLLLTLANTVSMTTNEINELQLRLAPERVESGIALNKQSKEMMRQVREVVTPQARHCLDQMNRDLGRRR